MLLLIVRFFHWLLLIMMITSAVNFRNNSVGYVCVLLLRAILPVESQSNNCVITDGGLTVECVFKVNEIPQEFDPKITKLDLSHNTIHELRENSFKKYINLATLLMKDVTTEIGKVDLFVFRPLKKLKVLDLSESKFGSPRAYFYFPASLTILSINGLHVQDIDLSHMKHLKELHAKDNHLLELPIIHELAPLWIVDLQSNFLEYLTPERLAPFCKLQTLNLKLHDKARLIASPQRYCICVRVNLWITLFNIQGEKLTCDAQSFEHNCDQTFSDSTLSVFNDCLQRYKKSTTSNFLIIVIVVGLLVASSGLGYAGYYYYTNQMKPPLSDEPILDQTEEVNDSSNGNRESSKTEQDDAEI